MMQDDEFIGAVLDMDAAYMCSLGALLVGFGEAEVFDAYPMLFGYSL